MKIAKINHFEAVQSLREMVTHVKRLSGTKKLPSHLTVPKNESLREASVGVTFSNEARRKAGQS